MKHLLFCIIFLSFISCKTVNYSVSIKNAYQRLEKDSYTIFKSKNYGDIQYKMIHEEGIPVLVIHGLTGGYDQGILTGTNMLPENHKMLSISRFGYLKSAFPDNPDPLNQSKAFLEIMDSHHIEKVFILATSAGGTIAFKFALLYPERVAGLILFSSAYPSLNKIKEPERPPDFVYRDWQFEFLLNHMQGIFLKLFGISKSEYFKAAPEEQEGLKALFNTILPVEPKKNGMINDLKLINYDMRINYPDYPIESIEKPFLILHSKNDPVAKYEFMKTASKRLKNVKTCVYEKGGHALFGYTEENRRYIADFINKWSD